MPRDAVWRSADPTGVMQIPLYTLILQDGTVSIETKAKIAEEITRIHTTVMKVSKNFVRVVFLLYPRGAGVTGGEQAPTASLNCVLAKRPYPRGESRHAGAALDDVPEPDWNRNGSARTLFRKSHPAMQWKWARSFKRSDTNRCCSNGWL